MAPIVLPVHFALTLCNRTGDPLVAASTQFVDAKTQRVQQPAQTVQDIRCATPVHGPGILSFALLDGRGEKVVRNVSLALSGAALQADGPGTCWKGAEGGAGRGGLRVLYRCAPAAGSVQVLLLPARDAATFLSSLGDGACLTSLCLPGTHESLALHGWPISSCQSADSSVSKQLQDGIRYLDIRLAPKGQPGKERLLAYHGITDQRIEFASVLDECFAFLDGVGRRETIVMSLKQEQGEQDTFIKLLFTAYVDRSPASKDGRFGAGRGRWFLEDRVPTLGEARGRIVMLSRFVIAKSYGFPGGISPPIWPNSEKGIFEYDLRGSGQHVQTQDWYDIGSLSSIPEKMSLIERLCQQSGSDSAVFSLNYCNGSSFPLALPPTVAKGFLDNGTLSPMERSPVMRFLATQGVNVLLRDFVADSLFKVAPRKPASGAVDGLKVTFALDYYNEPKGAADCVSLLIEANF